MNVSRRQSRPRWEVSLSPSSRRQSAQLSIGSVEPFHQSPRSSSGAPQTAAETDTIVEGSSTLTNQGQQDAAAPTADALIIENTSLNAVWNQIQWPSDWTSRDSNELLDAFQTAFSKKDQRQWPNNVLDKHAKDVLPEEEENKQSRCLQLGFVKKTPIFDPEDAGKACKTCRARGQLCLQAAFVGASEPGAYDEEGTLPRWTLTKRSLS